MSSVTSGGSSSESNAASSGGSWNMNTTWTSMPDSGKSSSGAKDESITCNETPKATSWAQAVSGECSSSSASTSAKCDLQPSVSSSSASNSNAALQVSAPSSNNNGNIQSHGCSRPSSAHSDSSAVRPVESLPDDELSESNNLNVSKLFQPSQQEFDQLIQTDLYSRDWGRSVINHETSWEGAAPKSKASDSCGNPSSSSGGPAVSGAWKAQVSNSGTELWESTLRQGKSGNTSTPPTKTSAPQWTGHTPANHIGGTWGEEEEDNGNMWTGVPGPNKESGSNSSMRSACNPPGSVIPDSVAMPNQKPWLQDEAARPNWNVENEPPTQPKWGNQKNEFAYNEQKEDAENWSNNGACMNAPPAGWEEQNLAAASLAANATSMADDGTALWGAPQGQNKVLIWKDDQDRTGRMPNEPLASSPGVLRIPSNVNKEAWKQGGKSFTGQQVNKFPSNFGPIKKGNWNDQEADKSFGTPNMSQMPQPGTNWSENATQYWNKQKRNYAAAQFGGNMNPSWNDGQFVNANDWANMKSKTLSREMILASNQYKMLVDQGFKKEDVESALRQCNMNIDETIDELRSTLLRDMDMDLDKRNKSQITGNSGIPQGNINRPTIQTGNSNPVNLMHSNPPTHLMMQGIQSINYVLNNPEELMSLRQDKMLFSYIQSVQLGVQEGHLSCQLLNQPLAFSSIKLICSLLDKIRYFHQLQMKINTVGPNPNNPVLKIYLLQQAEAKQHIQHFQKLISQEQNMFLSQQQEVINMNRPPSFVAKQFDNGKPVPDLNQLTADIGSMQLGAIGMSNGPSSASQAAQAQIQPFASNAGSTGQSRLAQWKLDSAQHDKPDELHSKFNRAPGVNVKPNNCNSWSAGIGDTWDNGNSFKDPSNAGLLSTSAPNHHAQSFNQFGLQQVNEFEPGKAWKQSQLLKSNDPSSQPVSINKEQIAYWPSPNQPSPSGAESLVGSFASNSTWSFPGGNGGSSGGGSGNAGIGTPLNMEEHPVNGWPNSNLVTANGSEMWNRGKPKGPPPGLGQLNAAKSSSVNPWSPEETQPGNNTWIQNSANQSAFLLLRNLVQIDSSTLKTLCMQHGSLQLFHFQQESGVALIKYTSRDQALKARSALNQFSFGNANVIAEIPSEQQVQQIQNALQQSSSGQSNLYTGSAPVDNISASNVTTNGWSSVGQSNSNALWSYSQMAIGPGNSSQSNVGANSGNGGSIWQTMDSNPSNLLPGNLLGEST